MLQLIQDGSFCGSFTGRVNISGSVVLSDCFYLPLRGAETIRRNELDDMHLRKIDLADEIFVINVGGYIGESTSREIEYAQATGKTVRYLERQEKK